jgi:hypothetical protein
VRNIAESYTHINLAYLSIWNSTRVRLAGCRKGHGQGGKGEKAKTSGEIFLGPPTTEECI